MMCLRKAACATAFIITMHPSYQILFLLYCCAQKIFLSFNFTYNFSVSISLIFSGTQKENEEIVVQDTERTKAGNNKLFMK